MRAPAKATAHTAWEGRTVHADSPQEGFYKVNVRVDGCGWVATPARLWKVSGERDEANDLIEDEVFAAHVAGKSVGVEEFWPGSARHPISEDEYNEMCRGNPRWQVLKTDSGQR